MTATTAPMTRQAFDDLLLAADPAEAVRGALDDGSLDDLIPDKAREARDYHRLLDEVRNR